MALEKRGRPDADEPADHALGYSRGGFGLKLRLPCDSRGLSLAITLTAGQRREAPHVEPLMESVTIRPNGRIGRRPK